MKNKILFFLFLFSSFFVLGQNCNFQVDFVVNNRNCCTTPVGSISAIPSGNMSDFSFLWLNGSTSYTANNLYGGTHGVWITQLSTNCRQFFSFELIPYCNGGSMHLGEVNLNQRHTSSCEPCSGGMFANFRHEWNTNNYYKWNNWGDMTSSSFVLNQNTNIGLCPGIYQGIIKSLDHTYTTFIYTINSVNLTCPINVQNAIGNTPTGSACVSYSCMPQPNDVNLVSITWSNGQTGTISADPTVGPVNCIDNLMPGTYVFQASYTGDLAWCLRDTIVIGSGECEMSASITSEDTPCGTFVTACASNGRAPYTFVWSNGETTTSNESCDTIWPTEDGLYCVTITDATSCSDDTCKYVKLRPVEQLIVEAGSSCNCLKVISSQGGVEPITYTWYDENGAEITNLCNAPAGNYTLVARDACHQEVTLQVVHSNITVDFTQTPMGCRNTKICANVSSTGNWQYYWDFNDHSRIISTEPCITVDFESIGGRLTILDYQGDCKLEFPFGEIQNNYTELSVVPSQVNVRCFGESTGSASVAVTGGEGPYSYIWVNGVGTGNQAGNLAAGTYTVHVYDQCDHRFTPVDVTFTITQPTAISYNLSLSGIQCGTRINAEPVTGGVSPYTYAWSPVSSGNSYFDVIADGLNEPVNYTVTVTDQNGCILVKSRNVQVTLPQIPMGITKQNVLCNGASTGSATYNYPSANYTYTWTNTATNTIVGGNTSSITNLPAGQYRLVVNGPCFGQMATSTFTITQPSSPITFNIVKTNDVCGNPLLTASNIAGGTTPYNSCRWSDNQIGFSVVVSPTNLTTYTATVTDNNGCTATQSIVVTPVLNRLINATAQVVPTCNGLAKGSARINVTGGSGNFSYTWTPNVSNGSTASNLSAGNYTVRVVDICTNQFVIVNFTVGTSNVVPQIAQVTDLCRTTILLNSSVTGAIPGCTYLWSNNMTTQNITTTCLNPQQNFTLNVTDSRGCVGSALSRVFQCIPQALGITTSTVNICNGVLGKINVTMTGGSSSIPYRYTLTGPTPKTGTSNTNAFTIDGLAAGTYTLTVNDQCGNTLSRTIVITQLAVTTLCSGLYIQATVTGGTPTSYIWKKTPSNTVISSGTSSRILRSYGLNSAIELTVVAGSCSTKVVIPIAGCNGAPVSNKSLLNGEETEESTEISIEDGNENVDLNIASTKVYPNPNIGNFTFEYNNIELGQAHIQIYDYTGKVIFNQAVEGRSGKMNIDIQNATLGLYLYKVISNTGEVIDAGKISIVK